MKKLRLLLLIIGIGITISIFSCRYIPERKILLDLPDTTRNHSPNIFYESKKSVTKGLNLNELENGVDSLEIRFWIRIEVFSGGDIFVIKKINDKWTCIHYRYYEKHKEWKNDVSNMENFYYNLEIDSFSVRKNEIKTNWPNFFVTVKNTGIYKLPVQDEIKNFKNIVSDGITYYVEFATNSKYKFYYYNCPKAYMKKHEECRKMVEIIEIFKQEFVDVKQIFDFIEKLGGDC
jgi:hypothetical protein